MALIPPEAGRTVLEHEDLVVQAAGDFEDENRLSPAFEDVTQNGPAAVQRGQRVSKWAISHPWGQKTDNRGTRGRPQGGW